MSFLLVIYTVVAMAGQGNARTAYDWRPIGEFGSKTSCEKAAMDMGYKKIESPLFRCLDIR